MAHQTSFNADKSVAAERSISSAVEAIDVAVAQLRSLSERFQAAAGTDQKNGNLKSQSKAEQQNSQQKGQSTTQAAGHDQQTAADARGEYTNHDFDNAASIKTTDIGVR